MAYENVTPPPLPEYDSTTYPNYLLVFNFDEGSTDWSQVHLLYAESPFVYDSDGAHIRGSVATYGWQVYDVYDAWAILLGQEFHTIGLELDLTPGLDGEVFQRIYTNHDILDSNGNVYLAADCVTPVSTFDLRSWLVGYTIGICGKPLPLSTAKKEPIAYSYNGVVLPDIESVWDKENYQSACILSTSSGSCYLWVCAGFSVRTAETFYADAPCKLYRMTDGSWVFMSEYSSSQSVNYSMNPFWASADIPAYDGSVYLEASEPTPVYE